MKTIFKKVAIILFGACSGTLAGYFLGEEKLGYVFISNLVIAVIIVCIISLDNTKTTSTGAK